jgi:hypothetical protein
MIFRSGGSAEEIKGIRTDGKKECCRKICIDIDVEGTHVLRKNRRGRSQFLAMIDEPGLDILGRMMVDHDIYVCIRGNRVVLVRN